MQSISPLSQARIWFLVLILPFFIESVHATEPLDRYMELASGEFSSEAMARRDKRYDAISWQVVEIWQGSPGGERWLYTESRLGDAEVPYMQRITRVTKTNGGSVLTSRFQLPEAEKFVGAWQDLKSFDSLKPEDLIAMPGCEIVQVRTGPDQFEGSTQGSACTNSFKGASYTVSHSTLRQDGMINWDRGIAENGTLVWGPAWGGYQFERSGSSNECNQPVHMLVFGTITDMEKFITYGKAIDDSGLYDDFDGYYVGTSPAIDVFEGQPPTNRAVLIAKFPCLAKAQGFWKSDTYAAIKPLRYGIADFEVLVLKPAAIPAWIELAPN